MASIDFLKGIIKLPYDVDTFAHRSGPIDKDRPTFMRNGGSLNINGQNVDVVIWNLRFVTYHQVTSNVLLSFSFGGCAMGLYVDEAKTYGVHIHDGTFNDDRKKDFIDFIQLKGIYEYFVFQPTHVSQIYNVKKLFAQRRDFTSWGAILDGRHCYSIILEIIDGASGEPTTYRTMCIVKHSAYEDRANINKTLFHYGFPGRGPRHVLSQGEYRELKGRWNRTLEYDRKAKIIYKDPEYDAYLCSQLYYPIVPSVR